MNDRHRCSKTVLALLAFHGVVAPSQLPFDRTKALSVLHNMTYQGKLKQVRRGTAGNPSKLLTYNEPLFALKT